MGHLTSHQLLGDRAINLVPIIHSFDQQALPDHHWTGDGPPWGCWHRHCRGTVVGKQQKLFITLPRSAPSALLALVGVSQGKVWKAPEGPLPPPSDLRVARVSVNWEGKNGSEGAAVGVQRLGAWPRE